MVTRFDKSIVLLGFMGSGKSTLGKQLALTLGWRFTDLDRSIETETKQTIPEIFETEGEPGFRKLESDTLRRILAVPAQVIAIGGGAPCNPLNINMIKENSWSVYLKISEAELAHRLIHSTTPRPLLKGKTETEIKRIVRDLLAAREPYYLQADLTIESDEITAGMILSRLEKEIL